MSKIDTEIGVKLHNRFDIEVRDAATGELKQQARAYNIILDQMYSYLCNFSEFFTRIFYGTGTGTLDPTRTTMFAYKGGKLSELVTRTYALPISTWQQKIVLNPSEEVGTVITEVGIAATTLANSLLTHALLQDIEGNTISITKTATDIITIYATLFVVLPETTTDYSICGLISLTSNYLLHYLLHGTPYGRGGWSLQFCLGSCATAIRPRQLAIFSEDLGHRTLTITPDVANRKRKYSARFEVSQGNGNIRELGVTLMPSDIDPGYFTGRRPAYDYIGMCRVLLPIPDGFNGQPYVGVPLGTGNGIQQQFVLPSKDIKEDTIVVYKNGTLTEDYEIKPWAEFNNFIALQSMESGTSGTIAYLSRNLLYYALPYAATNISLYSYIDRAWQDRRNYSLTSLEFPSNHTISPTLSDDGLTMVVWGRSSNAANIYTWKKINNIWTHIESATFGPFLSNQIFLNYDGSIMYECRSNVIRMYEWDDVLNIWTQVSSYTASHTTQSKNSQRFALMSKTYDTIACYDTSNGILVFDIDVNTQTITQRTRVTPVANITDNTAGWYLSANGLSLIQSSQSSGIIEILDWNGDDWISRDAPIVAGGRPFINEDGTKIIIANSTNTYLYEWVNSTWVLLTTFGLLCRHPIYPTMLHPGLRNSYISDNFSRIIIDSQASGSPSVHEIIEFDISSRNKIIVFDDIPDEGDVITANYTVEGIHKTDQYIIDVSLAIVFGEGGP